MRISDWSSDVCSSDLTSRTRSPSQRRSTWCRTCPPTSRPHSSTGCSEPSSASWVDPGRTKSARAALDPGVRIEGSPHRSEEHTSELQSLMRISYAVFCLKKKTKHNKTQKINSTHK